MHRAEVYASSWTLCIKASRYRNPSFAWRLPNVSGRPQGYPSFAKTHNDFLRHVIFEMHAWVNPRLRGRVRCTRWTMISARVLSVLNFRFDLFPFLVNSGSQHWHSKCTCSQNESNRMMFVFIVVCLLQTLASRDVLDCFGPLCVWATDTWKDTC